jgi:hypothetical protein
LFTHWALLLGTIKPTVGLFAKDHYIASEQISSNQWQLVDAAGKTVSLEQYKEN